MKLRFTLKNMSRTDLCGCGFFVSSLDAKYITSEDYKNWALVHFTEKQETQFFNMLKRAEKLPENKCIEVTHS